MGRPTFGGSSSHRQKTIGQSVMDIVDRKSIVSQSITQSSNGLTKRFYMDSVDEIEREEFRRCGEGPVRWFLRLISGHLMVGPLSKHTTR